LSDLIRHVHATDGYPVILQDDVQSFLITTNSLAAWVADDASLVKGHVSLHTVWSDAVAELACPALSCDRSDLGAVSRLFVAPDTRGTGVGRALLDTATHEARRRGLHPVLDVVTTYQPAIALYEHAGWTRLGTTTLEMPNGQPIAEHVYALTT
jgi:GNAT superfamily N-acetyltransferase